MVAGVAEIGPRDANQPQAVQYSRKPGEVVGGLVWWTLLEAWQVPLDSITFFLVCYNFAVVGVVAIFYQKGIPMVVTQGYLVCTSVLMAWQLSKFEEWTGRRWARRLVGAARADIMSTQQKPCPPDRNAHFVP